MSDIVYEAIIPLNPITKKNNQKIITNRRTNRPMIVQNDRYTHYEQNAGWYLRHPPKIDYPVNIECRFYRANNIRCDLTNLLEAIDDILIKYRIITDDNFKIIVGHDGSRVFVDKDNPRTEIIITRCE